MRHSPFDNQPNAASLHVGCVANGFISTSPKRIRNVHITIMATASTTAMAECNIATPSSACAHNYLLKCTLITRKISLPYAPYVHVYFLHHFAFVLIAILLCVVVLVLLSVSFGGMSLKIKISAFNVLSRAFFFLSYPAIASYAIESQSREEKK